MERILQAGAHGVGHKIEEARATASSASRRAEQLARDLAETHEDLLKMRELVTGNERKRQGLEHRMSELENNLSEIRGSLRVSYTGLHQLVGECGVTTTIPATPDEFSLTSLLAELAAAMEEIPSKHAARIGEEMSNGIYTRACHVLACVKLACPDLDLQKILDQGAANSARSDCLCVCSCHLRFPYHVDSEYFVVVVEMSISRMSSSAGSLSRRPRECAGRPRSSNPILEDEIRGGRTREDYGGSEEGPSRGGTPRSQGVVQLVPQELLYGNGQSLLGTPSTSQESRGFSGLIHLVVEWGLRSA
uniref:Uncharacterized protein n=1 Tax=Oryza sativa subsp. japonica TaxID=39947 RepID=Q2R466_ORYSJ|nr:hypothetical protein LOC_Os11g29540 [Oryza sativa Japonica Group]